MVGVGLLVFQSFAGMMDLSPEALSSKLREEGEKVRVILANVEGLVRQYTTEATQENFPNIAGPFENTVAKLNEPLKGSYVVEKPDLRESVVMPDGAVALRLNIQSVGTPGVSTPVVIVLQEAAIREVIVGQNNIDAYALGGSRGPGIAGSAFGEHDPESMDYVRTLLPQAQSLKGSVTSDQLDSIKNELRKLVPTVLLPVDRLPVESRSIPTLSNIEQILAQTLVVDDPQDRFLVAFVDEKPIFERRFLDALIRNGDFTQIAQHLMHEDLEPRVAIVLKENGITDIHPHDVVTQIQTQLVAQSVVGRENALYDAALAYRAELGTLSGKEATDAGAVQAYRSLSSEEQAVIADVAGKVVSEPVGIALSVSDAGVTLAGIALPENLANAVRNSGLTLRNFLQGEDLSYQSVVQFLTRAILLNRVYEASKSEERVLAGHQVKSVTDAPKAAIIDIDTLLTVENIDDTNRTVDVSQAAVGISKALSEKIAQIQAEGGNLKIFLVSKKIRQDILDHLIRQMDASVAKDLPVAVSYKDVGELMAKVSEKFEGRTLTSDDVLFYVTKENANEYRADPNFAQFYKVIQVEKAQAGERVSVAKLLVGIQWLYLSEEQARNIDQVVALFRDVLTELYEAGEISREEYQALLPTKDSDTNFLVIPPVKADSMTQQIEDSLRTTIAAAKFA
jgi:hypothetical protein